MAFTVDSVDLVEETGGDTRTGCSYQRIYDVKYSGGAFSAAAVRGSSHATIIATRPGEAHPDDSTAVVERRAVQRKENATDMAKLTVDYASPPGGATFEADPIARKPVISGGGGTLTEVRREDFEGKAVVNSAGDFYADIPPRPVRSTSFVISRNEAANPANRAATYSHTFNSVAWHGVGIGNALMGEITWAEVREIVNGVPALYYAVSYPITCRNDGWKVKLIDNGYKLKVGTAKRNATDDLGNASFVPILLNGSGGELSPGADPVYFPPAGYQFNDDLNWTTLALPDPFATATP